MQAWRLIRDSFASVDTVGGNGLEVVGSRKDNPFFGVDIPDNFTTTEHPKYAFSFTMEVLFSEGDNPRVGDARPEAMDIALKTATRPQPTITYTDANFYNMRTKVATSIDWGTITVVMYDDAANRANDLYTRYINSISPIANLDFVDGVDPFGATSSVGPLNRRLGLIKLIKVYQYYTLRGKEYRNVFTYFNPKISNVMYDDLAMDGEVSTISMSFTCDGVNVQTEVAD